jgi:hypothetical protein
MRKFDKNFQLLVETFKKKLLSKELSLKNIFKENIQKKV